ncbi:MAG TPA: hypothetical protein VHC22_32820 [Pirellulales bacterium]|nr:hypothetical protein [Pirellulales bacterium]
MSTNPYLSPTPDPPAKVSTLARWNSLVCWALATYCGFFFIHALIASRVIGGPLTLSAIELAALGVVAWTVTGLTIRCRYWFTSALAGAVGMFALLLLVV